MQYANRILVWISSVEKAKSPGRILIATSRLSFKSVADTFPIPSWLIFSTIRQCKIVRPISGMETSAQGLTTC